MNQPVVWTPTAILIVTPVVICGVIGLLLCSILVLGLLLLGMKPAAAIR